MKLLVIGIDGADRRLLDAMPMPNLSRLLNMGHSVTLREDLWERGWAKTLTGVSGAHMGGFYMKPRCDGTRNFVQSYKGTDYDSPHFTPIWDLMKTRGKRVGMMNIPTTSPVPEVDGFIVGGAGGGLKKTAGVNPETCWPRDVASHLDQMNYIFDTRFLESEIRDFGAFFSRLRKMAQVRTEAFCSLCNKYDVDMGYVAYMSTSRPQYLMMKEIMGLVDQGEMEAMESARPMVPSPTQKHLIQLYEDLDDQVGRLMDELSPDHWLIVGDHGASPMRYRVNLNSFLRQAEFQRATGSAGFKATIKKMARSVVPRSMRRRVGKSMPAIRNAIASDTDWDGTKAFADRFYGGIYVYDADRFGGSVASDKEAETLTDQIVERLNAHPVAKEHRLSASAYRRNYRDAPFEKLLPEVMVTSPDGYFFESFGPFVERNHNLRELQSMNEITMDMFNGMKGSHPLFCTDLQSADLLRDTDPADLRLVYHAIDRIMS